VKNFFQKFRKKITDFYFSSVFFYSLKDAKNSQKNFQGSPRDPPSARRARAWGVPGGPLEIFALILGVSPRGPGGGSRGAPREMHIFAPGGAPGGAKNYFFRPKGRPWRPRGRQGRPLGRQGRPRGAKKNFSWPKYFQARA